MNTPFVTVIIPAFNEGDIIYHTVKSVKSIHLINQVIVVDDGSTDNTSLEAKRAGAELVSLSHNRGKGYALYKGLKFAKEKVIAFIDGDTGDTAIEISRLVYPVINKKADITIAKIKTSKSSKGFSIVKRLASFLVFIFGGKYVSSPLSGQRVMTKEVAEILFPLENDYSVEIDETIKALQMGFNIHEIEVKMSHRQTKKDIRGFYHRFLQGYQILKTVIWNYLFKKNQVKDRKNNVANKRFNKQLD